MDVREIESIIPYTSYIGRLQQMLNTLYKTYIGPINLNVVARNQVNNQRKKCYNYNKERHFVKDYR